MPTGCLIALFLLYLFSHQVSATQADDRQTVVVNDDSISVSALNTALIHTLDPYKTADEFFDVYDLFYGPNTAALTSSLNRTYVGLAVLTSKHKGLIKLAVLEVGDSLLALQSWCDWAKRSRQVYRPSAEPRIVSLLGTRKLATDPRTFLQRTKRTILSLELDTVTQARLHQNVRLTVAKLGSFGAALDNEIHNIIDDTRAVCEPHDGFWDCMEHDPGQIALQVIRTSSVAYLHTVYDAVATCSGRNPEHKCSGAGSQ